jgi:hypothetical protein
MESTIAAALFSVGREQLVDRNAKRAKSQIEVGDRAVWKPDFNRGQLLPAVLLEELVRFVIFSHRG